MLEIIMRTESEPLFLIQVSKSKFSLMLIFQDRVHDSNPINILTRVLSWSYVQYLARVRSSSAATYPPTTESRAQGTGLRDPITSGQDRINGNHWRQLMDPQSYVFA